MRGQINRKAHQFADSVLENPRDFGADSIAAARAVKAHVPAPPATLADELREWGDKFGFCTVPNKNSKAFRDLADRVEAVGKENRAALNHAYDERDEARAERDEARAEVERKISDWRNQQNLLAEYERLIVEARAERDEARAEVERLTATFKEPLKEPGHLPDPADVPEEELWVMDVDGQRLVGFCSGEPVSHPWETFDLSRSGGGGWSPDRVVRLRHRLVPDTRRVIDRVEALDALPVGSIVIDGDDDPWKKTRSGEWILGEDYQTSDELLRYIATSVRVIHEPEETP